MAFTAADVKRLREETDAPMMECNNALKEADGNYDRAKEILREKGKAAAAKRSARDTSAGVAMFVPSADGKCVGGVVIESETDFVARNEQFVELAQQIAQAAVEGEPGDDPSTLSVGGKPAGELVSDAVAKIRENIKLVKAVKVCADAPLGFYTHHDKTKAAVVVLSGTASNLAETGKALSMQAVAFPPLFAKRDEVPAEVIEKELELETQRAINEGKDEKIAKNIAQGRVNKEYFASRVLEEQPFYADNKKTVKQYIQEQASAGGGTIEIVRFVRLAVGES